VTVDRPTYLRRLGVALDLPLPHVFADSRES
jgi:hypothetical protein